MQHSKRIEKIIKKALGNKMGIVHYVRTQTADTPIYDSHNKNYIHFVTVNIQISGKKKL